MIVHRFMSEQEYRSLMAGKLLVNTSQHEGWLTNSVGFCFFVEDPEEAIHWLSGITDPEYCVTMEIPSTMLIQSVGHYRNPAGGVMDKVEWCTTEYSLKNVTVLSATDKYRDRAELRKLLRMAGVL